MGALGYVKMAKQKRKASGSSAADRQRDAPETSRAANGVHRQVSRMNGNHPVVHAPHAHGMERFLLIPPDEHHPTTHTTKNVSSDDNNTTYAAEKVLKEEERRKEEDQKRSIRTHSREHISRTVSPPPLDITTDTHANTRAPSPNTAGGAHPILRPLIVVTNGGASSRYELYRVTGPLAPVVPWTVFFRPQGGREDGDREGLRVKRGGHAVDAVAWSLDR